MPVDPRRDRIVNAVLPLLPLTTQRQHHVLRKALEEVVDRALAGNRRKNVP